MRCVAAHWLVDIANRERLAAPSKQNLYHPAV